MSQRWEFAPILGLLRRLLLRDRLALHVAPHVVHPVLAVGLAGVPVAPLRDAPEDDPLPLVRALLFDRQSRGLVADLLVQAAVVPLPPRLLVLGFVLVAPAQQVSVEVPDVGFVQPGAVVPEPYDSAPVPPALVASMLGKEPAFTADNLSSLADAIGRQVPVMLEH